MAVAGGGLEFKQFTAADFQKDPLVNVNNEFKRITEEVNSLISQVQTLQSQVSTLQTQVAKLMS